MEKFLSIGYICDMALISTQEAADRLGVSKQRITALVREGRLPAKLIGNSFAIDEADLKTLERRKRGRPPKDEQGGKKGRKRKR